MINTEELQKCWKFSLDWSLDIYSSRPPKQDASPEIYFVVQPKRSHQRQNAISRQPQSINQPNQPWKSSTQIQTTHHSELNILRFNEKALALCCNILAWRIHYTHADFLSDHLLKISILFQSLRFTNPSHSGLDSTFLRRSRRSNPEFVRRSAWIPRRYSCWTPRPRWREQTIITSSYWIGNSLVNLNRRIPSAIKTKKSKTTWLI